MFNAYWKNNFKERFQLIQPGEFWMGTLPPQEKKIANWKIDTNAELEKERNCRVAKITRPFFVDRFPTTVADFDRFDSAIGYDELLRRSGREYVRDPSDVKVELWVWGKGKNVSSQSDIWRENGENEPESQQDDERYGWSKRVSESRIPWREVSWDFSYDELPLTNEEKTSRRKVYRQGLDNPVVGVNRKEVFEYVNWLNTTPRIQEQYEKFFGFKPAFRLMTEAEYEYCARAGSASIFPWGDEPEGAREYANVADGAMELICDAKWDSSFNIPRSNSRPEKEEWRTFAMSSPVGAFEPNNFGLYDMIGNVLEMTSDPFEKNDAIEENADADFETRNSAVRRFYADKLDREKPDGEYFDQSFVCKGGAWCGGPDVCRPAARIPRTGWFRSDYLGFRVCFDAKD